MCVGIEMSHVNGVKLLNWRVRDQAPTNPVHYVIDIATVLEILDKGCIVVAGNTFITSVL